MRKITGALACSLALGAAMLGTNNTFAASVTVNNYDDLVSAISSAASGDTINLEAGTYGTGAEVITIDKDITLVGAGKTSTDIYGGIALSGANVTLQNLTVGHDSASLNGAAAIRYLSASSLTLDGVEVAFHGYDISTADIGVSEYYAGVDFNMVNDSALTINNSSVIAKYGIWVHGANETVTINDSEISGWAALEVSLGNSHNGSFAAGNVVNVTNSTLTGYNFTTNCSSNSWGTIVFGQQDGLVFNVENSTIASTPVAGGVCEQSLLYYGGGYSESKNVSINITNSTLSLTEPSNATDPSYFLNYNLAANAGNSNLLTLNNVSLDGPTDRMTAPLAGHITLTVTDGNKSLIFDVAENYVMTDEMLGRINAAFATEGYIFRGVYADADFTTPVAAGDTYTQNTTLYVDRSEITPETGATEEPTTDSEGISPQTSDLNTAIVFTVMAGALLALSLAYRTQRKARR